MQRNINNPFTLQDALNVQQRQLLEWKNVLTEEVYTKLYNKVKAKNEGVINPYHVFRGTDIFNLLLNDYVGKDPLTWD